MNKVWKDEEDDESEESDDNVYTADDLENGPK